MKRKRIEGLKKQVRAHRTETGKSRKHGHLVQARNRARAQCVWERMRSSWPLCAGVREGGGAEVRR